MSGGSARHEVRVGLFREGREAAQVEKWGRRWKDVEWMIGERRADRRAAAGQTTGALFKQGCRR